MDCFSNEKHQYHYQHSRSTKAYITEKGRIYSKSLNQNFLGRIIRSSLSGRQKKAPHAEHEGLFRIAGDASKPGFVVDNHSSRPEIARRLKRSTRSQRGPRHKRAYLILLRVEFTLQPTVTSGPVRSYRTLSALPVPLTRPSAVFSLLHLSSVCTAQTLSGTLPCGARTFLPLHR